MKISLTLFIIFISFVSLAYSGLFEYDLLGGTQLNGAGCVCHTTERDTTVTVWIEGPDTLNAGQTGLYKMFMFGGPAEAGGYNVAGRFGTMTSPDSLSYWNSLSPNELTQAFPLVFPTPQDTIYWEFEYTASDSVLIDTLYSCGLSIVYDSIPNEFDRWNFGPKFPVVINQNPVPVELTYFNAEQIDGELNINWQTASEINNKGFSIQRSLDKQSWNEIGFVEGNGTSSERNSYHFIFKAGNSEKVFIRLKQIDFDGTFKYSSVININPDLTVSEFSLAQNYPNPFNPETKINFSIPSKGMVKLDVYNLNGEFVLNLIDGNMPAGDHSVKVNLTDLASGVYIYSLAFESKVQSRKMILLK